MQHAKKILVLRQLLIGRRFNAALHAMEFAAKHHTGFRKDGRTPEFDHQTSIALFALTLPEVLFPEELITTILLHDVPEDYNVSQGEIGTLFAPGEFRTRITPCVDNMTKVFRGVKRDEQALFAAMAADPIASIAKGCDRIHNFQSMVGVFTIDKQVTYLAEGEDLIMPMLKKARRNFPEQVTAYENIKGMLSNQIALIRAMHAAYPRQVATGSMS